MQSIEKHTVRFSLRRAVRDGVMVGAAFALVTSISLVINPMAWVSDYPPDVQAAVAPAASSTTAFQAVVAGLLVMVGLGGYTLSVRGLARAGRDLTFFGVARHVFVIYWVVNAIDVVVVDWILFMHVLRRWIVLPGTEGLAGYDDYFFHFRVSFLERGPWLGSLIVSLVAAGAWWLLAGRKRGRAGHGRSANAEAP